MQLVMGLGNPGTQYADTRHNIGFACVEIAARRLGLRFGERNAQYRAAVGEGPAGPVTLLEPLTYMNRSGQALRAWSARTGLRYGPQPEPPSDAAETVEIAPGWPQPAAPVPRDRDRGGGPAVVVPVVVCDDLQLGLGSVRIRGHGSAGGQKGLASILQIVGGDRVPRLRLGVGPLAASLSVADWSDYVLEPFAPEERATAAELAELGADALLHLLEHGWHAAALRYNRRVRPGDSDASPAG